MDRKSGFAFVDISILVIFSDVDLELAKMYLMYLLYVWYTIYRVAPKK